MQSFHTKVYYIYNVLYAKGRTPTNTDKPQTKQNNKKSLICKYYSSSIPFNRMLCCTDQLMLVKDFD